MTIAEASKVYGVPHSTIRKRLWYDTHKGKALHGSAKLGRDWFVTVAYMETKWGVEGKR